MTTDRQSRISLATSLIVHLVVIACSGVVAARQATIAPPSHLPELARTAGGDTFDVDGLIDGAGTVGPAASGREAGDSTQPEQAQPQEPAQAQPREPAPQPKRSHKHRRSRSRERSTTPEPAATEEKQGKGSESKSGADSKSGTGTGAEGEGRRYGPTGAPRGVQNLATAFARALPAAISADPVWRELPVGELGSIDVTFEVAEGGAITKVILPEGVAPELRAMIDKTRGLLGGEFALGDYGAVNSGRETLHIDVVLSQGEPPENEVLRLGNSPPTEKKPGTAHFIFASGRRFDAAIRVVSLNGR